MEIVSVPITSLSPHSRNYRSHPEAQLAHLQASLQEFGWARNVVVSSDNVILAGHGIVEAARRRGETEVPVHRLNLPSTDPKAEKFMVLENEVSRLADDDEEQLAALLADIQRTDGLEGTGYDDAALAELLGDIDGAEFVGAEQVQALRDMAAKWLVAFVIDENTKRQVDDLIVKNALPDEHPSATVARLFQHEVVKKS